MTKFSYESINYLDSLKKLPESYYSKYILFLMKNLKDKKGKFLDVGCGNGRVLELMKKEGYSWGYGVEISKLFVKESKSKDLEVYLYDGINLPFKNDFFDLIGSFNVLEHSSSPELFLKNQVEKLKKGGVIIVACPNFLSVLFMSYHRRLKGVRRKLLNLLTIFKKTFFPVYYFERMEPVIRKDFQYDDDAIVVTNLLDLRRVLKRNKCEIEYESGFINYDKLFFRAINSIPFMKYLLPSCFVVARKK